MITITSNISELENILLKSKNRYTQYFSLMEENIQHDIINIITPNAPFVTGNLLNHLLPLKKTSSFLSVGIESSFVPYVYRVMYGSNSSGGPFSIKGNKLFERMIPPIETSVQDNVDSFFRTVFEGW